MNNFDHNSDCEYSFSFSFLSTHIILLWKILLTIPGHPSTVITVIPATLSPQQVLTLHLPFQAGDVAVAEVLAQLLHLLQLQQVDPQHLDGADHEVIHFLIVCEEWFLVSLLVLYKSLNVHIERLTGWALR